MNISEILTEKLWNTIESDFNAEKYTNAIIEAMLYLSNILREKSGLEEDGVKLVNRCFSQKDPKIKINKLETATEKNIQEGVANILRGMYQLIRNPRHHEKVGDKQDDAIQILLFINYLICIIEKSKAKFEINDFMNLIFDVDFVDDEDYVTLLISKIPKRKRYELIINIYKEKRTGDINIVENFLKSLFNKLSETEKSEYFAIISDDLIKTSIDQERKYILKSFPSNYWQKIERIAVMRTENKIINSINEGKSYDNKESSDGWFATWCTNLFEYFVLKDKLISTLGEKICSSNIAEIKYFFKFMSTPLWGILDSEILGLLNNEELDEFLFEYSFIITIKDNIEKGNNLFYYYIDFQKYSMPKILRDYFKSALDNFIVNSDIKTLSKGDLPEITDDDVPF